MFSNSNCASVPLVANIDGNGNNSGWNGDGAWLIWIVLIFALFGFGGFGFGGFGGNGGAVQGYATQSDIQRGFDTSNIVSKLDGITNGLSDGFYAMNTGLMSGFNGVDKAVCELGYQTQSGFNTTNITLMQMQNALQTLISQCCCETREAIQNVNYNLATQSCDIKNTIQNVARDITDNANANGKAILDFLVNDKIATLTAENQSLKFQASQTAQNQFITQVGSDIVSRLQPPVTPSYIVPNPNTAYYGCCNSGCAC